MQGNLNRCWIIAFPLSAVHTSFWYCFLNLVYYELKWDVRSFVFISTLHSSYQCSLGMHAPWLYFFFPGNHKPCTDAYKLKISLNTFSVQQHAYSGQCALVFSLTLVIVLHLSALLRIVLCSVKMLKTVNKPFPWDFFFLCNECYLVCNCFTSCDQPTEDAVKKNCH